MKLIEDLGVLSNSTQRYGLYECPKCDIHFTCRISEVTRGKTISCPKCVYRTRVLEAASRFIVEANIVHNYKYDYSLVNYTRAIALVRIICPIHGVFLQSPSKHKSGRGCPTCGLLVLQKLAKDKVDRAGALFPTRSNLIHNYKYDYIRVIYLGVSIKVEIVCPEHGSFWQTPMDHLDGCGCPMCAISGFNGNKSATLYYIKVYYTHMPLYKIGITNRTIKDRFTITDKDKLEIIKTWDYSLGSDAYEKEQEILELYKEFKYMGPKVLSSGNTELFIKDVLGLDTPEHHIKVLRAHKETLGDT